MLGFIAAVAMVLTSFGGKDCPEGFLRDHGGTCEPVSTDTDADGNPLTYEYDYGADGTVDYRETSTYDCP